MIQKYSTHGNKCQSVGNNIAYYFIYFKSIATLPQYWCIFYIKYVKFKPERFYAAKGGYFDINAEYILLLLVQGMI